LSGTTNDLGSSEDENSLQHSVPSSTSSSKDKFVGDSVLLFLDSLIVFWDYEIIVVEDASNDDTVKIVNNVCVQDNRIKLLSLPYRLGKGGSIVVAGLSAISKNLKSYMDVDLAVEPLELQRLIENIHDSDIVVGSRILRADLSPVRRPFHREILSWIYSKTFRVLFRMPITILSVVLNYFEVR
jgi:glycosyltransferase involved in cell wall biosynthesis